jgi:hypothetical protein
VSDAHSEYGIRGDEGGPFQVILDRIEQVREEIRAVAATAMNTRIITRNAGTRHPNPLKPLQKVVSTDHRRFQPQARKLPPRSQDMVTTLHEEWRLRDKQITHTRPRMQQRQ